MRSQHLLLFLIVLLLLFSSSSSETLIQKTCKKCSETSPNLSYEFCVASLGSSTACRRCSDLRQLGWQAIRLTRQNVTRTWRFVKHLAGEKKSKKLDPHVRACLSDCMELYGDAIPTLKEAAKGYKSRQYDDVNIELSSVVDVSTTCEDGFGEMEGVVSPLTKRNDDAFQLSIISLSIVNMLNVG